ncbi:MAG: patatin-like phospholipase family protein, partial [Christensenellales bacterium]
MNKEDGKKDIKIGVALGGGGMCGVAHIGFLQVLEENGIKIDMLSGVSMGAIIGGLYATGWSGKELENLARTLSKSQIIEPNFFKMLKEGLVSGKKIEKFLEKHLKCKNIEESPIKFYAGAADLKTGKIFYFDSGNFTTALRASSAIPGLFPLCQANNTI